MAATLRRRALAAVLALAALPFAILVPRLLDGAKLTGASGLFAADQLQYMGLIHETGRLEHVGDHFPMFLLSGLATHVGIDVRIAFLVWVPISAVVLVLGFDRYVREFLGIGDRRLAALALALFYFSPVVAAVAWGMTRESESFVQLLYIGDYLFPAGSVWGYPQIALALGLMPICLLYGIGPPVRPHALPDRPRLSAAVAPLSGALVGFLHPWQGVVLLGVHALTGLGVRATRTAQLAATMCATAIPLAYYWIASRTDDRFALSERVTQLPRAALWVLFVAFVPLGLALIGTTRERLRLPLERQLMLWPLVSIAAYFFESASWRAYFLLGSTLPLAILAVRGAGRMREAWPRPFAIAAVAALTVPGTTFAVSLLREREYGAVRDVYALRHDDARAVEFVARSSREGGVVASDFLPIAAWALTGRDAWAASPLVSPEYQVGTVEAERVFSGEFDARATRHFVRRTKAAFVIRGCAQRGPDLTGRLGPLVERRMRFGCATVFEIRALTPVSGSPER